MTKRGPYGRKEPVALATLGDRIRAVRRRWRWTQERLAEAIGSDQRTLSSWERNVNPPKGPVLELLAALFSTSPEALETGAGFLLPEPPADGAAEPTVPYLAALPPHPVPGIWLVDRSQGRQEEVLPRQVQALVREARRRGRPVWIVVG